MTGKETSVLALGLVLVVFLVIMKNNSRNEVVGDINSDVSQKIKTSVTPEIKQPDNNFKPNTDFPTIKSIFDVPEWKLDLTQLGKLTAEELIKSFHQAIDEGKYFEPESDNALFYLANLKTIDKNHSEISNLTQILASVILEISEQAISTFNAEKLIFSISRLKALEYDKQKILKLETELSMIEAVDQLYTQGIKHIENNEYVSNDNNDAWHSAKQCQILAPENPKTIELVNKVENYLLENALLAAEEVDFQLANTTIGQAELLDPESTNLTNAKIKIQELKQQRYQWLEQQMHGSMQTVNIERAEHMLQQLQIVGLDTSSLQEYQNEISMMKIYGSYQPFEIYSDRTNSGESLPKMVVMPTGKFLMGASDSSKNESPKHLVNIQYGFAVSQFEITVADFRKFIQESGYKTDSEKSNSSRVYDLKTGRLKNKLRVTWEKDYLGKKAKEELPVIHVSWNDAKAYVQWVAQQTGKNYRLLSEAEFEYIVRSGSGTYYPWGEGDPIQVFENLAGKQDRARGGVRSRWIKGFDNYNDKHWGPAPVGSFISNPFRLFDTAGNVMEWVEDCWHDSYTRAPADGSAWINPGCENHVIRGGAWSSAKQEFSSSHRFTARADFTDARVGFRIAMDIPSYLEKN